MEADLVHEFFLHALEHLTPRGSLPEAPDPPFPAERGTLRRCDASIEQAHVVVGFLGACIQSPDRYALRVGNSLLSGQGGRLFRRLRDELGLAYAVTSACVEGLDPGYLAGYLATAPENAERARLALLAEFENLARGEIFARELEEARRKLVGSFEISLQENAFQAAQMALDEIYGLSSRSFETFAREVFGIPAEAVSQALGRYVNPLAPTCLVLGP